MHAIAHGLKSRRPRYCRRDRGQCASGGATDMTRTISGTYSTLVTLGSSIDNPTTITSSGLVNDGLQISFAGLTLLNSGKVAQGTALNGVDLRAPGSVTNQSGGTIAGGRGIAI